MKFTLAMAHNGLLKKIPNSNKWKVVGEFVWYVDYFNKKDKIIVFKGFETDFGSIPKPLRIFFNPTRYISYILHDFNYTTGVYTRREADQILLESLHVEGASGIERFLVYLGVRIAGFLFYKN